MPAFRHSIVVLIATLLALAPNAQAQPQEVPAGLEKEPLEIEVFGLRFHPPAGTEVVTEKVGPTTRINLSDSNDVALRTWTLRIAPAAATAAGMTPQGQIQEFIKRLKSMGGTQKILVNEPVHTGTGGHVALVEQQRPNGAAIAGWLVMNTGDEADDQGRASFLIFSFTARPDQFEQVWELLNAAFSTISITSMQELSLARRARLERGRAFIEQLTPEALQAIPDSNQWIRIYIQGDSETGTSEHELGYSHVQITKADRSALDTGDDSGSNDPGLLVRVQARVVLEPNEQIFYDTYAEYWLGFDQQTEAWVVRATQRHKHDAIQSSAETGLRTAPTTGDPRPALNVITQSDKKRTRDPYRWEVPDVYLSQVLNWILGPLLPTDSAEPIDLSYYFYFPNPSPRLTLRHDSWAPMGDGSDKWILTTVMTNDTAPIESVYTTDGAFVQRRHQDGALSESIELDDLETLWRRKGMQMRRGGR
jgi:hypothetical protein